MTAGVDSSALSALIERRSKLTHCRDARAFAFGPQTGYTNNIKAEMVKRLVWLVLAAAVLHLGAFRSSCLPAASSEACGPCCPTPSRAPAPGSSSPLPACCLVTVYRSQSATALVKHSSSRAERLVPTAVRSVVPANLATVSAPLLSGLPERPESPPIPRLEQSCLLRI